MLSSFAVLGDRPKPQTDIDLQIPSQIANQKNPKSQI